MVTIRTGFGMSNSDILSTMGYVLTVIQSWALTLSLLYRSFEFVYARYAAVSSAVSAASNGSAVWLA